MQRQFVGKTPQEAISETLLVSKSMFMATPGSIPTELVDDIYDAIMSTGALIRPEDAVDDHTVTLIQRLVEQNATLERAATLYAERIAATDFIALDRDMWRTRCQKAEREVEQAAQRYAREVK